MSDTNKKILLVLGAIAILVLTFVFVIKPKREEISSLESEISELQARYDDLCEKEKHKDEYIQETADFNAQFDEIVADYPADLNQESVVMFMKGVEEANDFINNSISLPRDSVFYVLGQGEASAEDVEAATSEEGEDAPYVCSNNQYAISWNGSYEGIKEYLNYIATYKYRMAISSVSISYDVEAEDPISECTGSVLLNAYAISGPNRTPDEPSIDVDEGKDNIFVGDLAGGIASASSYDTDGGEAIVASHNLVLFLNNANNDSSSGIIVASNESDEKSYVSSTDNEVKSLDISISEEDGKNYLTYGIGSDEKKVEITTTDVTIYVKSSNRVDSDDKNGVDVNLANDTSLNVYIKVVDDDTSSPRFKLAKKSGAVKVY